MAERDADAIKKDIAAARDQLASTVDLLAARAHPRNLAERVRTRAVEFIKKPAVSASLAGVAAVGVALVVHRARVRRLDRMILKATLNAEKSAGDAVHKLGERPWLRAVG